MARSRAHLPERDLLGPCGVMPKPPRPEGAKGPPAAHRGSEKGGRGSPLADGAGTAEHKGPKHRYQNTERVVGGQERQWVLNMVTVMSLLGRSCTEACNAEKVRTSGKTAVVESQ